MLKRILYIVVIGLTNVAFSLQASNLPVVPLPKLIVSPSDAVDTVSVEYGEFKFCYTHADASLFSRVQEEFKQLENNRSTASLEIYGTVTTSLRILKLFCQEYGIDEKCLSKLAKDGYLLHRDNSQIQILSHSEQGLLYGLQTAKQLVRAGYSQTVTVADWADFDQRIFFDDISRGPISNLSYIKKQIRDLSELKYNAFTFYIEHVIQSTAYPDFAPADGKLTLDDVRVICEYAKDYGLDVIGSFQSFGHFDKILEHEPYAHLGNTSSMIDATNPEARTFLKTIIEELSAVFSSDYFNINCDETWDLEKGKTKEYVASIGADTYYANHVRFLYDILKAKGKRVMLWGDIMMKYPHLLDRLPKDITYLSWNYGGKDYTEWIRPFKEHECLFVACPGILNSNRLLPDYQMTKQNLWFIIQAHKMGAQGVMYTSWDDSAFHTFAPLMYGVAMAAEQCWNASDPINDEEFSKRFCQVRLGSKDNKYVQVIEELNRLSTLSLTYEMNDRIFYDSFTPAKDKPLNIQLDELENISQILDSVGRKLEMVKAKRNLYDIQALTYVYHQYLFIVSSRQTMWHIANLYKKACRNSNQQLDNTRLLLIKALNEVQSLFPRVQCLKNMFEELWIYENQPYYMDKGTALYKEKINQIARVEQVIKEAVRSVDQGLPLQDNCFVGLEVNDRNSNYFSCWLLAGCFMNATLDVDYLHTMKGEKTAKPIPGERFEWKDIEYKWSRYFSENGFAMDFNKAFHSINAGVAYAYAQLHSEVSQEVEILYGGSGESIIYCNGTEVGRTKPENEFVSDKYTFKLLLTPGDNRIMIKSKQLVPDWRFSFRLNGKIVKAHKQKYNL